MKENNAEDLLNFSEILSIAMRNWRVFIFTSFITLFCGIGYYFLAPPLYKSQAVLIASGGQLQNSSTLLAAFGGFPNSNPASNNFEKVKTYIQSSLVIEKVLARLDTASLEVLKTNLNSKYFGLVTAPNNPNQKLRSLAFKFKKMIILENASESSTSIRISVETPSPEISKLCLELLIEEVRNFHNESEKMRLKKQEAFSQFESAKYREKLFRYALDLSKLSRTQNSENGLIEVSPSDLDLQLVLTENIKTTPQVYFEYKSTMQDMYKTFAKSLEQNFQTLKIDSQRQDLIFDIIETPYGGTSQSSPRLKIVLSISGFVTIFVFSLIAYVLPTLKTIFSNTK